MTVQITCAKPDDLEVLLLLMCELQLAHRWEEPFDEAALRKVLATLLREPGYGVAYVAWDGAVPVGYLVICFDYSLEYGGKGAWIDELFVRSTNRGKGIGTQLLDLAESGSREHGARALHLEVSHGNRAIELYRRRGFTEHHRFLMTKNLSR